MQKKFYSNGKLLLSGEYTILDGATGLAIPTKYGQSLEVTDTSTELLEWKSLDENGEVWFEGIYAIGDLKALSTSDQSISTTLTQLLNEAKAQNPDFLKHIKGVTVETKLSFARKWGLGTSSTLINNIAQWAEVDAYLLLQNAFGGSGYDIACAKHDSPILYQLINATPKVEEISFNPEFRDALYFVYLNQKQNSKAAINLYRNQEFDKDSVLARISSLTKRMVETTSLNQFETLIMEHEGILSSVLGLPPIKTKRFADYPGAVKSLGAWGGDFVLVTGNASAVKYFKSKGFDTVIPYSQMVLGQ
ncbi:GYDIA family GHMP kinase [Flagellimonas sp. 2504JD4-2]